MISVPHRITRHPFLCCAQGNLVTVKPLGPWTDTPALERGTLSRDHEPVVSGFCPTGGRVTHLMLKVTGFP